jgi:hypothetical protein
VGPGIVGIGPLLIFGNAHRGLDVRVAFKMSQIKKKSLEKKKSRQETQFKEAGVSFYFPVQRACT